MLRPRHRLHPYLFLAPTLGILGTFFLFPLGLAAYRSLYRWDLLTPPRFVGLAHYERLFSSGEILRTLTITLSYAAVVVSGSMFLGLLLALAVNRKGKFVAFVRSCVFSAYVVSWVSVALLWMWLLDADAGLVGRACKALGIGEAVLLTSPSTAIYALAGVTIWKITGFSMVVFLAGRQDIPEDLYEAASLDGAGPLARFVHITWPCLRPTTAFVGTTSLIVSFQAFDIVRVMTQGGPTHSTTVFVYAIYEHVLLNLRAGRASAMVVVFFGVLLLLTLVQLWAWRMGRRSR
ncbi:MAG TPA: sugar ABC transporter permease [Polyangiaceae bacterium]|nr:sugar ABC transporter permease [Polyangiaceae bacterium]